MGGLSLWSLPGAGMQEAVERPSRVFIGDIELISLWDGTLDAKLDSILNLDPLEARRLIDDAARETSIDPLVLPVRAFLLRSGGRTALIDTGSGNTKGPTMGHLAASLAAADIQPEAVDAVLLTHVHMDHIGGMLDEKGRPTFPNAEVLLHHREAEYFVDTPVGLLDARSARHVEAQRAALAAYGRRVRRVEDGEGPASMPGVVASLAPGHTPGHACWRIRSGSHEAVAIGDIVHLGAVQLPRPLSAMIYDVDAAMAASSRVKLLREVASHGTIVAGAHLPSTGLGRIGTQGNGFSFHPL